GRILHTAALRKTLHQDFDKLRKFLIIPAAAPLGFTGKSGHALRDIGLKANPLLFAIVNDIDARRRLFLNDMLNRSIHRLCKLFFVHSRALFALDEQIGKLIISRQAADMGDQNAFAACFHRLLDYARTRGVYAGVSPPLRGGLAATSTRYREASFV